MKRKGLLSKSKSDVVAFTSLPSSCQQYSTCSSTIAVNTDDRGLPGCGSDLKTCVSVHIVVNTLLNPVCIGKVLEKRK